MINSTTTRPLPETRRSLYRPAPLNWQQRGIGILRISFGLVWVVASVLEWLPPFQNTFVAQVSAAQAGQPALIQAWISLWTNLVSVNPLLFAQILAATQTALAVFLILGLFSNLTSIVGIFLSLGIWSIPEGFGGPYIPGHTTDIGPAFPYAILFAVLLCISAGRYYGLDQWLTPRLGQLGFLASGSVRRRRK